MIIEITIAVLLAYLIGSLSSAIIVCRLFRLPDPRSEGSRNPGATNVLRLGGKLPAFITLVGDMLKGWLPVMISQYCGLPIMGLALVALAAFIGHLYPLFFRFEGGKGVATLIGCLFALSLPAGLCWAVTWLIIAFLFRYSSLASLTATFLAPLYIWLFTHQLPYLIILCAISLLLFYRHRSNLLKLWKGTESKIGQRTHTH